MPFANAEDGVRIRYEVEGEGAPLVLMHGFSRSLQGWYDRGYVEQLRDRYRLVLIDGRGHGESDKPTTPEAYDFRTRVLDIASVLQAAEVERAHLWGYSMGGIIAQSAAIYAPQRFLSLVIGGASPYGGSDMVTAGRAFDEAWPSLSELPGADREAWRAAWQEGGRFRGSVQALKKTRLPFLLYAGEDDRGPLRGLREFCAKTDAKHFTVPGKNHQEAFVAADEVVPRVVEFLEGVPAA